MRSALCERSRQEGGDTRNHHAPTGWLLLVSAPLAIRRLAMDGLPSPLSVLFHPGGVNRHCCADFPIANRDGCPPVQSPRPTTVGHSRSLL